jgi:fatty acid desaturase
VSRFLGIIDQVLTFLFMNVRDRPHRRAGESSTQTMQRLKQATWARRLSFAGLASLVAGLLAAGSWLALLAPVGLVTVAVAWLKGDRLGLLAVGVVYFVWYASTVVWVMLKAG